MSNGTTTDQLLRICKDKIVVYLAWTEYGKTGNTLVRIAGDLTEIRTKHPPNNTIVGTYCYTNLLSKIMMSLCDTGSFDSGFMIKQGEPTAL
jgi:hypothetical protein